MKSLKRFTAIAVSLAFTLSVCSAYAINKNSYETQVKAADDCHDDWIHAEGNRLYDMNGNEVWLTGCNWFGYNVGSQVFDGVWSQNMHQMLNEIADHGFNLLRVPMSTEILLQWKNNEPDPMVKVNTYANPELSVDGTEGGDPMYSFDIWNLAVKWCKENGIKIMIDIHSAETASAGHQVPVWYSDKFSEDDWVEALEWVTEYYKDDDTLIALDLKNEPHGKKDEGTFAKWDDSDDLNNWKRAAERGAKAVLDINPNLLIMVEGIEVYPKFENGMDWNSPSVDYAHYDDPNAQPYHGTWWGGNFRGAKEFPIDLGEHQKQLVYSPHDYGPLVYNQTWFYLDDPDKTFDRESLMNDCWRDNWFYLYENETAPLLMGEWGGFIDEEHDPTGENTKWMTLLRDLMIENHINHTFWCFNENSGDTGGLVYDNFGKWDEEKYALVEPALWQDENGKFISLDHQRPMGQSGNGISVSEYYGGTVQHPVTTPKVTEKPAETVTDQTTDKPAVTTTEKVTVTDKPAVSATTTKPSTKPEEPSELIYGDLDENGKVDVTDLSYLSLILIGDRKATEYQTKAGDVDASGSLNLADLAKLRQYLSKVTSTLGPVK